MIMLKFYIKKIDVEQLVEEFLALPEAIRPVYFSEDEGCVPQRNILLDKEKFLNFLKKNPSGFLLYSASKEADYDVSTSDTEFHKLNVGLSNPSSIEYVVEIFNRCSRHKPLFGFAYYSPEASSNASGRFVVEHQNVLSEYHHRNRDYTTIGENHIESWIGRDIEKYICGVYWYTLVSDELLDQHNVELNELSSQAITVEKLGDGSLHLLKFFDNPEDWRSHADRLDDLCEKIPGIFSRRPVEAALHKATSFLEYNEIVSNWK